MSHQNPSSERIRALLTDATTIAVVGASADPARPSHGIMKKLLAVGYRVLPVNPNEREVLGVRAYPKLAEIAEPIDIVNVFRRPEYTLEVAEQAVAVGAKVLWLQSGIVSEAAAERAAAAGLLVVMDECIGVQHSLLRVPSKTAKGRA